MANTTTRTKWPKFAADIEKWILVVNQSDWPKYQLHLEETEILPLSPEEFWGGNIDYPKPGCLDLAKQVINIGGWILGKTTSVINVDVKLRLFDQEQTIGSIPLNYQRSDIGVTFAHIPGAAKSGFDVPVSVNDILKIIRQQVADDSSIKLTQLLKIHSVTGLVPDNSPELWNFCFDKFYVPLIPSGSNQLVLSGWLLPKRLPTEKINVISDDQIITSLSVNIPRADVKQIYPQVSWAMNSGFSGVLNIPVVTNPSNILLQAQLKSGNILPLAKINYSFVESSQYELDLEFVLYANLENGKSICLGKIKGSLVLVEDELSTQLLTRQQKVLYHINKNTYGIEIGPSHNPIAPKKEGYKVHIIDHLNREELITKYIGHNLQLENIEEVDFVWHGQDYATLTGKSKFYDWIIASHVIEHTPDFIGFLLNCDSILKDDGIISLVVPDKRFCFDHFRPITGLSKIIDAHYMKQTIHTPGSVAEYFLNTITSGGKIAWEPNFLGDYAFITSLESTQNMMERSINSQEYIDVHAWCFTPHSFRLMIDDLYNLGLIPFREVSFFPTTNTCEFYVILGRQGKGPGVSRLEMLEKTQLETLLGR